MSNFGAKNEGSLGLHSHVISPISNFLSYLYIPSNLDTAQQAEKSILKISNLDIVHNPPESHKFDGKAPVEARLFNSFIDEANYIRTLHIRNNELPKSTSGKNPPSSNENSTAESNILVITHGFGNGLGFYFKNYEELSKTPGLELYSIDWLGMGLSSRPDFKIDKSLPIEQQIKNTEEFFVESLEIWRKNMNIEKMNLLGHSFGGYMSSLYALKYPQYVNKLILESPVGVQGTPPIIQQFIETGNLPKIEKIVKDDESKFFGPDGKELSEKEMDLVNRINSAPFYIRFLFNSIVRQWDSFGSPQSLLRGLGRLGPIFTNKYASRFTNLSEQEIKLLADYLYHVSAQKGSGEYSIGIILKPFAFARMPLITRLDFIKVPTYFIYGDRDWMDYDAGVELSNKINPHSKVFKLENAGHNMHLDNPEEFNNVVKKILLL
ncbi:putative cardiolipin-specific deacylase, mitochondrial [Smittium culicis]|uniref:Putative cardiolipin-specific deacylase, mitochondrial n=1 Tax=Smittium culicis TaxID=133412 RepID=A0A1R1XF76_9FUNG|nr:putative cardiolipin-specific deacylase, mitochondrial [Smittium culicis]